jgi:hypothetical protein
MNLDQLSAFAITEDHERQERVWSELPTFNRSRESILRALSEGQVPSDDRRAVFVGAKAYEEAGGGIIRDQFDAEGGGFFADAELLNRLARAARLCQARAALQDRAQAAPQAASAARHEVWDTVRPPARNHHDGNAL